ncbi:hypothetical protein ACP70R_034337 [Stipagrostis hirtigluma subsp. patula]
MEMGRQDLGGDAAGARRWRWDRICRPQEVTTFHLVHDCLSCEQEQQMNSPEQQVLVAWRSRDGAWAFLFPESEFNTPGQRISLMSVVLAASYIWLAEIPSREIPHIGN